MKITKFNHSCLYIQHDDLAIMIDPGAFSVDALHAAKITYLDYLLITHEHQDHVDIDMIREIENHFGDVVIIGPESVVEMLADKGIDATTEVPEEIECFEAPHESVEPLAKTPRDTYGYHVMDMLTHPGDSLHFEDSKEILALPVTAPWGASTDAIQLAIDLQPQYVIPIHDSFWTDEAKKFHYDMFETALKPKGITLLRLETGKPQDIKL